MTLYLPEVHGHPGLVAFRVPLWEPVVQRRALSLLVPPEILTFLQSLSVQKYGCLSEPSFLSFSIVHIFLLLFLLFVEFSSVC